MINLFLSENEKQFYLVPDEDDCISCRVCRKIIESNKLIFFITEWRGKKSEKFYYHPFCFPKKQDTLKNYDIQQKAITLENIKELPTDAKLILESPIQFKWKTNVFDAAISNKNIDSDRSNSKTIDHCKLANKYSSVEGAKIGADIHEKLEELDQPFNSDKLGLEFLDSLTSAKPIIEYQTTEKIEFQDPNQPNKPNISLPS